MHTSLIFYPYPGINTNTANTADSSNLKPGRHIAR